MTSEEALELLKSHEYWADISILDDLAEAAIQSLEKEKKYAWHNLKKNPNDLPDKNIESRILVAIKRYGEVVYEEYGVSAFYALFDDFIPDKMIGWKYLELFEE